MNLTTKEELRKLSKMIERSKTVGPNSIPARILNEFKDSLSQTLAELFNLLFRAGRASAL